VWQQGSVVKLAHASPRASRTERRGRDRRRSRKARSRRRAERTSSEAWSFGSLHGFGTAENGRSLSPALRQRMGPSLATDLGGVRIHDDARAASLAQSFGARALTFGSDLFFNQGEFQPGTAQGKHLVAHELTHVAQQAQGGRNRV